MTTKDLRDIAAYYHSSCSDADGLYHTVDSVTMDAIEIGNVRDFKLHLRSISSLTDEEIWEVVKVGEWNVSPRKIDRWAGGSIVLGDYDYFLGHKDGEIYCRNWNTDSLGLAPNTPAVFSYLQFIGIYVPGSINEDHVQLIEP